MLGRGTCWQLTPQWSTIEDLIGVWGGIITVFFCKLKQKKQLYMNNSVFLIKQSKTMALLSLQGIGTYHIAWKFPFIHQIGFQYSSSTALMQAILKVSSGFHFPCYAMLLSSPFMHRRVCGINYKFAEGNIFKWGEWLKFRWPLMIDVSLEMLMKVSPLQDKQRQGMLSFDWSWRRHRPRETQINPFWKICSVLSKHKRLQARSTPLQEEEAVFGAGSALRACFKTLAFPLGGLRGGATCSYVNTQSRNNLSQPAVASYELWNPAKTLEEQSHSLHLPVLAPNSQPE